jgi:homoserine kinase type II
MNHLAAENFPAPKPIKTKTENWCGEISGKTFALVSFLSGKSIVKPQAAHMKELGHFTAKMHKAGENFQANRQNNFDLNSLQKLANSLADSLDKIDENLFALVSETLNHCKNNWPNNLPRGLIHADLFPDNVFFLDKNLSGVIDFYFACTDIYAYELAICLNAWCFENSTWNANLAQNFLDHYHSERKLSAAEWNALPLLMRGGAIRFLLTRTQDFSQKKEQEALVHHKDPKEYSAKLYFHHQRKNLSDYGLSARA